MNSGNSLHRQVDIDVHHVRAPTSMLATGIKSLSGWARASASLTSRAASALNLGDREVARARADGYTLMADALHAITRRSRSSLRRAQGFDPGRQHRRVPNVMDVNIDPAGEDCSGVHRLAKANPDKISMGSGGIGCRRMSPRVVQDDDRRQHAAHSLPRRGAGNPPICWAGACRCCSTPCRPLVANIRAGKIRALAVTSKKRSETLPEVPAMNEFVPGYEADSFHGISAPKGTPREIVDKLNRRSTRHSPIRS